LPVDGSLELDLSGLCGGLVLPAADTSAPTTSETSAAVAELAPVNREENLSTPCALPEAPCQELVFIDPRRHAKNSSSLTRALPTSSNLSSHSSRKTTRPAISKWFISMPAAMASSK
jgi:hypothetical protein